MPCSRTHNCAHATTDTAYATLPARAPAPASVSAPDFLTDSRPHQELARLPQPLWGWEREAQHECRLRLEQSVTLLAVPVNVQET